MTNDIFPITFIHSFVSSESTAIRFQKFDSYFYWKSSQTIESLWRAVTNYRHTFHVWWHCEIAQFTVFIADQLELNVMCDTVSVCCMRLSLNSVVDIFSHSWPNSGKNVIRELNWPELNFYLRFFLSGIYYDSIYFVSYKLHGSGKCSHHCDPFRNWVSTSMVLHLSFILPMNLVRKIEEIEKRNFQVMVMINLDVNRFHEINGTNYACYLFQISNICIQSLLLLSIQDRTKNFLW